MSAPHKEASSVNEFCGWVGRITRLRHAWWRVLHRDAQLTPKDDPASALLRLLNLQPQ